MTENEKLNIDDCLKELKKHRDVYLKRCAPWRIVNRAIRLIEQYRAIGTVEELQALKLKEHNYDNCHNYTCRKKCEKDGYAKAIDEFAERLKDSLTNNWRHFIRTDSYGFDWITTDAVHTHIEELLKRLKGENT